MGNVEDVRKVLQDFLAPELHTITARMDALEKVMLAKFEAMDFKFEAMDARFEAKFDMLHTKLDSLHKDIEGISDKLDLDRRLTKLESQQVSPPARSA